MLVQINERLCYIKLFKIESITPPRSDGFFPAFQQHFFSIFSFSTTFLLYLQQFKEIYSLIFTSPEPCCSEVIVVFTGSELTWSEAISSTSSK